MRFIKLGLLSIFFLFIVSLGVSLLIPSHIRISRATNLAAGSDTVLRYIRDTTLWPKWHPIYVQVSSGGALGIKRTLVSGNDSEVVVRQQQGDKTPIINGWKLHRYEHSDSLTLQWYMDFQLGWTPWRKFSSLFYEPTYGRMMEEGLVNLKGDIDDSAR